MNTITINELTEKLRGGARPRLLDVRSPAEFAQVHATGAYLIPLDELSPATFVQILLKSLNGSPIYFACLGESSLPILRRRLPLLGGGHRGDF